MRVRRFRINMKRAVRNPKSRSESIQAIEQALASMSPKPDIVLVFIPDSEIYPELKALCDLKLGITTTCLHMSEVRKERGQSRYLSGVILKVNTKLGGINHRLDSSSISWLKDAMLVGMDVSHPGTKLKEGKPSIAAVVASCDNSFIQYPASFRVQNQGEVSSFFSFQK